MAYSAVNDSSNSSRFPPMTGSAPVRRLTEPAFDIFEWFPLYQSCQRYFLDHAQHSDLVHAVAAFLNIQLPCNKFPSPITSFTAANSPHATSSPLHTSSRIRSTPLTSSVSLIPYLRRLVATGMDLPGVLHGFFGDDWQKGIGPLHEQERRNYLFAAKSGGWAAVKQDYDMGPDETVPFLRPIQNVADVEIEAAEKTWSEWLAMEDWMVGSRAPDRMHDQARKANHTQ
ncbi:MAG: hypothetical protein M1814_005050 [Vezdaea aestivalis]|nr:MAG: hypothetical protein M1814_005050 [Vezdaea aestivalis]